MLYRYYRTPMNQRGTVKQYDDMTGEVIYEFDPATDTTMDVTIDMKREFVKAYHYMEDAEVKRNNKERKLDPTSKKAYDAAVEEFKKKFHEQHGRDPRWDEMPEGGHRSFVSLDAPVAEAEGATLAEVIADKNANFYDEEETATNYLYDLVNSGFFNETELALLKFRIRNADSKEYITNNQMGEEINTSGQYAGRVWKGIEEKIKACAELKKYFRI